MQSDTQIHPLMHPILSLYHIIIHEAAFCSKFPYAWYDMPHLAQCSSADGRAWFCFVSLECCYHLLPLSAWAITDTASYFCILHYCAPRNLFYSDCFDVIFLIVKFHMQLANGQIVEVPPTLIKRQKQHFTTLEGTGKLLVVCMAFAPVKHHFAHQQVPNFVQFQWQQAECSRANQ